MFAVKMTSTFFNSDYGALRRYRFANQR